MSLSLSVLDLVPVASGATAAQALAGSLELARHAERLGYRRYWLAEHHNMPGIASSAPEILIGQIARETTTLRVGSGGIMLPNHAPLQVAEAFQTLEALFPGRIDLGIGRAAGTDPRTALALRPGRSGGDDLPRMLDDLFAFSEGTLPEGHPSRSVRAVPSGVSLPPVWLLGSSDYSARLAGQRGLRFAFARHINPYGAEAAIALYRNCFQPSASLDAPYAMLTVSAICAETAAQADALAASLDLAWLRLHAGRPGLLPSVEEAGNYPYSPEERLQVQINRDRIILGGPDDMATQMRALAAQTEADEIMVTTMVHRQEDRLRSYELLARALGVKQEIGPGK